MTANDILTAKKIANIYDADTFLGGKDKPAILAPASDKQAAFASSRRQETLKLVCVLPATVREGVAADPAFDAARAEIALETVIKSWLTPRTAKEWIDGVPSLAGLCNEVLVAYQSLS